MPGFDPDQPRDEKGQWTDTGGSSAVTNAASDKLKIAALRVGEVAEQFRHLGAIRVSNPILPNDIDATINAQAQRKDIMYKLDEELTNLGLNVFEKMDIVEDMIRYQPFESVVVYDSNGKLITLNDGTDKNVSVAIPRSGKGGYMTHNHPRDQSFSNGDLNATVSYGFSEMRAASAGHDYIFKPNYNYTTDFSDDPVLANQEAMQNAVWDEVKSTQLKILSGEMDREEGNNLFQHRIFQRFAKVTGGKYSVELKDRSNVPDKTLLTQDEYKVFSEEVISDERRRNRLVAADDVNIQMRRLQKQLKKNF